MAFHNGLTQGIICIDSLPFERDSISGNIVLESTYILARLHKCVTSLLALLYFFSSLGFQFHKKTFSSSFPLTNFLLTNLGWEVIRRGVAAEWEKLFISSVEIVGKLWASRLPVARVKIARRRFRDSIPFRNIQLVDKRREEFLSECMRWEWI